MCERARKKKRGRGREREKERGREREGERKRELTAAVSTSKYFVPVLLHTLAAVNTDLAM